MRLPFVIAHEIAHALVCDKDDVALYSRTFLHDKYEYRDNCLAAKLLLSNTKMTGNSIDAKRIHIIHNDEESNMSIKDIFDPLEYPQ